MTNNDKNALELHKKFGGKITMALRDQEPMTREKLSAYYSPGVAAVSLAIEKDPSLIKEMSAAIHSSATVQQNG